MKKRNVQLHWRINQKKKEEKKEPHAFIKTQQHTPVSLPPACQEDRCPPTAYTPPPRPLPLPLVATSVTEAALRENSSWTLCSLSEVVYVFTVSVVRCVGGASRQQCYIIDHLKTLLVTTPAVNHVNACSCLSGACF